MEAPPLSTAPPTTNRSPALYPNSNASSPRSRKNESWEAEPPPLANLRLMCSYGGHIVPRPHDKTLCYVGGDTRIIVIDRHTSLSEIHRRLSKSLLNNQAFFLKYQLPNEDLDSLITVTSDEDLENMVDEYDRLHNAAGVKSGRLRLFLFPRSTLSVDQLASSKPEDWFFDALNRNSSNLSTAASDRGCSETSSVNNLLGLDDEFGGKGAEKDAELQTEGSKIGGGIAHGNHVINQDVRSVPDSPMLDTTSSFGSASSSPSMVNLPPIRVHVDDHRKVGRLGIEEQFQQMSVADVRDIKTPTQKQEEERSVASPLPVIVGGEYRLVSDDERSDHGERRKSQQIQQAQFQQQQQQIAHFQQKQSNAFDLPSPDSVSSDGSVTNQLYRQRQHIYHQEQLIQMQSGNSRPPSNQFDSNSVDQSNAKNQMLPQLQESNYVLSNQYDQIQPQLHQPQQFFHPGNQYIPPNAVPMPSYYSVYPPSQSQHHPHQSVIDQQHYPVYFVSGGRQTQAYNLPVQQPSYNELAQTAPSSHPQTAPPASAASQAAYNHARNVPPSKPEMLSGLYRTAATAAPQSLPLPSSQAQYVGYAPIQHPSSAANSNYAYEFTDPTHAQMYYTSLPPQLAAQYQTLKSAPASAPLPAETVQQGSR